MIRSPDLRYCTLFVVVACAAFLSPRHAQAALLLQVGGDAFVEDTAQPNAPFGAGFLDSGTSLVAGSVGGSVQTLAGTFAGSASSTGSADFGLLRIGLGVSLAAPAAGGGNRHNGNAIANVFALDDLIIDPADPALWGTAAVLHGRLLLTGAITAATIDAPVLPAAAVRSSVVSGWEASVRISDGAALANEARWLGSRRVVGERDAENSGTPVPGSLEFALPIRLGTTMEITIRLFGQVSAGALAGRGGAAGTVALLDTLAWGGIDAITTPGGDPIAFSVRSGSGFNYAEAAVVPLPATAWLLLTAIGGIGARAARRARPAGASAAGAAHPA